MDWREHIEQVPNVMLGKPIFRGTRMTVEFVLERLSQGATPDDLLNNYPSLNAERLQAAVEFRDAKTPHDQPSLSHASC